MRATRGRRLAGLLVAGVTSVTAGCVIEPPTPPSYEVLNDTGLTVEVRYLIDRSDLRPESLERLRSVAFLDPGEETRFGRLGNDDDTCLDAPLVAIGPDGEEIDRLPTGTCADRDVRPTWTITSG